LPCTAPFTLLSEHKCNKGEDARIPVPEVTERPWQLEPASFPHGEPLQLTTTVQQPRQSRRLNNNNNNNNNTKEDTVVSNGPSPPLVKPRQTAAKRRKPSNNVPAVGVVEEEESNAEDEMDEDTVVMNGEDVVMKDAPPVKPEPKPIQVIPDDAPVQFGEPNTLIAAWNATGMLATG
jgi:hypothetical protein